MASLERLAEVLWREVQILSYEPLRDASTIVNALGYSWGPNEDLPCIVIEHASYGTLDKFLHARGSFIDGGWDLCRSLCLDVAVALGVLHSNGIIHGDVKVENVLVYSHEAKYATAKLSDFGHSIFSSAAGEPISYLGTPMYNPPEVLRLESYTTSTGLTTMEQLSKCDVWAFGLMVWCTINAGKGYFQDQWLSQGRKFTDKLDFLINHQSDYLQLASSEFLRDSEVFSSAPGSIKLLFNSLLWNCLYGQNEQRCTMREASILLDTGRDWQHFESNAFRQESTDLQKASFGVFQVLDCIDSDIPWHFRQALVKDLLKLEDIRQAHSSNSNDSPTSCYITGHELIGYHKEPIENINQTGVLATCYATSFGVAFSLENMFKNLQKDGMTSGHTGVFIERIKQAHSMSLDGDVQKDIEGDWQDDAWFSKSIHSFQTAMYKEHRLKMDRARFQSLDFELHNRSSYDALLNTAGKFPDSNLEIYCRDGLQYLRPFLHFAVGMDDEKLAQKLIQHGANVDQQDSEERTALFEACAVGNNEIEKVGIALVMAGADLEVSIHQGKAWNLGWHGISISGTPLHVAVSCRNAEAIRVLLQQGANVNHRVTFRSPLDTATAYHLPDICELLIKKGAKVERYWVTGRSPLHSFGDSSLSPSYARLLLRHGSNIQSPNIYGDTALLIAVKDRADDVHAMKVILKQYDILCLPIDKSLIFPAIEASSFNNSCSKISELLAHGFEQTLQNSDGNMILHHCVVKGAAAALRMLATDSTLDLEVRNREGYTPLHLACVMDSIGCLAILCENGASVNSQVDGSKDLALSLALSSGSIEAFYILLQNNADPWLGTQASRGPTILHRICSRKLNSQAQAMNPFFLGSQNFIKLHVPPTSLLSEIMSHGSSEVFLSVGMRDSGLLNARNHRGCTGLHVAVESADLAAVEILLHEGADKNLSDDFGLKPLDYVDLTMSSYKRWRGGYSAKFDDIFIEIRLLLQDSGSPKEVLQSS
ncbi:hypothetical protein HYALB_00011135 [Hymenoscyphus albidus]|uniref:Protein kinase domain-containing protein n=1 Tax=Hymenoscyphus albidus TaxID=595503 RepID=A0A9N9LJ94_9HELO|nr:hypothetical protein HYALB_00011135 [Hymenoscyphus albidus]